MVINLALKALLLSSLVVVASSGNGIRATAQETESRIRVTVDMVQLNVAVTDNKGNYVTGIREKDFLVFEDNIPQKLATFAEGNDPVRRVGDSSERAGGTKVAGDAEDVSKGSASVVPEQALGSIVAGANVFVLFDTSNYMYRGFVFAQDAISDFVRSLETADKIALYSYSRDLNRSATLTSDRLQVLKGIRNSVAGDDSALYNALLLTIKDAAPISGRKVIVVFSNGPDNASVVPPEDVSELAQSSGISIYIISTQQAKMDPVSTAVFQRMSVATGGKAYFAKNWQDQRDAFASIRDDLAHLYSLSYYPQANPNRGWRAIRVQLVGERMKKYHLRTRDGYRPLPGRLQASNPAVLAEP
jgi:Ca-activated chloride channel homolog